jgi:hypothetical protein
VLFWIFTVVAATIPSGCGEHEGPGTIEGKRVPAEVIVERNGVRDSTARSLASRAGATVPAEQILFGDLHVHTTFSADAFMMGMPILQGEGISPIANACDYARYCSSLDFWSINDHAEGLTPRRWSETIDSIRHCNELAGDPANPDMVSFLGWEWTQIGNTPEDHYGHKNVIMREFGEGRVPSRPIHSDSFATRAMRQPAPFRVRMLLPFADWKNRQYDWNVVKFLEELQDVPFCPKGVNVHDLPADCSEGAATPQLLYEKLNQWGLDSMVIPHGTTWGIYTPPGSSWEKQLTPQQHDPHLQRLIEVFSGHGNSEEYRSWRAIDYDEKGEARCPAPRDGYEPCCWRAGEIIRSRCDDPVSDECEKRVAEARKNYLASGVTGHFTVPGTVVKDWKACGSCPDCYLPSFNYRAGSSVQAIMALSNLDDPEHPLRFRFGFMASSDNHSARPGTGYKEYGRLFNTEARGGCTEYWYKEMTVESDPAPESKPFDRASTELPAFQLLDFERQASYFLTGGLVAVHSANRTRDAIWNALKNRQVYGTSGERILLWFDLLNGPNGELSMGSEAELAENPKFRVRAAGSFKQKPGCPEFATDALSTERLDRLCRGECYNPSDQRHVITRIEVVRIRPQIRQDEPLAGLIEDPWLSIGCPKTGEGCAVEFEDPEFLSGGRETLYYVRAIQEPTLAVNAGGERCKRNAQGYCVEPNTCYGDYRTPPDDDCLAPNEERAWSSPIFVGKL